MFSRVQFAWTIVSCCIFFLSAFIAFLFDRYYILIPGTLVILADAGHSVDACHLAESFTLYE